MKKIKYISIAAGILLLVSCTNQRVVDGSRKTAEIKTEQSASKLDPEITKLIKEGGGSKYIWIEEYPEDFVLPDFSSYGHLDEICFNNLNSLDLNNAYLCGATSLYIGEMNLDNVVIENESPDIIKIELRDCEINRTDFFTKFPYVDTITIFSTSSNLNSVPDFSKNKLLEYIWTDVATYQINQDFFDKIEKSYPEIKIIKAVPGEL